MLVGEPAEGEIVEAAEAEREGLGPRRTVDFAAEIAAERGHLAVYCLESGWGGGLGAGLFFKRAPSTASSASE
jgi:hypothetical protein